MKINNRIVIDLSKVTHAWKGWVTQDGNHRRVFRPNYTVNGVDFDSAAKVFGSNETMLDRAVKLMIIDVWIPYTTFQLSNNHSLTYTGDKAQSLWKAWNERIFNKKGKK